jgi:predicted branched-subunit amino acid permease
LLPTAWKLADDWHVNAGHHRGQFLYDHLVTSLAAARTVFSLSGVRRGVFASQPLGLSVLAYGMAFGLLARKAELSLLEALLMSGMIFSGSAQLVAVNAMTGGIIPAGVAAVTVAGTILLLNARYLLYGAAIRPWLGSVPAWQSYSTLAVMGDGNWVLSMKAHADGEQDAGFIFGSGMALFLPWMVGTWVGATAGSYIGNPSALALDFLLVAFSAAMGVGMFKGRSDLKVVGAAVLAAVLADRFLISGSAILAAGMAGALTAWFSFQEEAQP